MGLAGLVTILPSFIIGDPPQAQPLTHNILGTSTRGCKPAGQIEASHTCVYSVLYWCGFSL